MRTFILMLAVAMVAIYNIAGAIGVFAWMLGLAAWGVGCGMFWYGRTGTDVEGDGLTDGDEVNTHNTDPTNTDPTNADTDGDSNDQPLLLALFILLDPCTTAQGAVNYSVCSSPYGRCTTTPADTEEVEAQPKFLSIRRNRMSHHGEADRRASRLKPDNSWKNHRSTQWR